MAVHLGCLKGTPSDFPKDSKAIILRYHICQTQADQQAIGAWRCVIATPLSCPSPFSLIPSGQ